MQQLEEMVQTQSSIIHKRQEITDTFNDTTAEVTLLYPPSVVSMSASSASAHEAMPVSRSDAGVAGDTEPETLPVSRSDAGSVSGVVSTLAVPNQGAPSPLDYGIAETLVLTEPPSAPVQITVDPLDEGIADSPVPPAQA